MSSTPPPHSQTQLDSQSESDGPAGPLANTTTLLDALSAQTEGVARSEFNTSRPVTITDHMGRLSPPLPSTGECLSVLSGVCKELGKERTLDMVSLANDSAPQQILTQTLLPEYFYSWNLKSPIAVLVSLLLHCFMYQRELRDHGQNRLVLEEHIHTLKRKVGVYQEQLNELNGVQRVTGDTENGCCHDDECMRLRDDLSTLRVENLKMQTSYENVCERV